MDITSFINKIKQRHLNQPEFHQAVEEVALKVIPFINENPKYKKGNILERMTEADRIIIFRVCWEDDQGEVQVNRGYRVQFNNAIGPYKGGLRFDESVNLSILKFLGFEQTFKNSLTTLPMGGAKGGANFNPKGKSDAEVMRFCQSFMTELSRHIGQNIDIPAGDIGVGQREVSFLFGQYKRLKNEFTGTLTGKGLDFGGSQIRTEATGYGCVYFAHEMLKHRKESIEGKQAIISGSGNVALYAAEKLIELGAKVISLSDRKGYLHVPKGLSKDQIKQIIQMKTKDKKPLSDFCKEHEANYVKDKKNWELPCDMAFPCATQNELDKTDAKKLLKNNCTLISEGANMPTTPEACQLFEAAKISYAPGKAANAGGVAISGIEMTQNAMRLSWEREEVNKKLEDIMSKIHAQCVEYGKEDKHINYIKGANIGGFIKVANTLQAYGVM